MTLTRVSSDLADYKGLHHQIFEIETLNGENWEADGTLTVFPESVFYNEDRFHRTRFDPVSAGLSVNGRGGDAGFSGSLHFTDLGTAFVGNVRSADGSARAIRGTAIRSVFDTRRKTEGAPDSDYKSWDKFSITTEWKDQDGLPYLSVVYMLGDKDVSDRTRVTHVDRSKGITTIEMVPWSEGLQDEPDSFVISLAAGARSFSGTYNDGALPPNLYNWTGQAEAANTQAKAARFEALRPSRTAALNVRSTANDLPTLSVQDLDNITAIGEFTGKDGKTIVIDQAQNKTGEYFNKALSNGLEDRWVNGIFGHRYLLPSRVEQVFQNNKTFFQDNAVLSTGEMLYSNFSGSGPYVDLMKKVSPKAMRAAWDSMGQDVKKMPGYEKATSEMYIEGFRDGVVAIKPYLDNDPEGWGKKYFDYLCLESTIQTWQIQIASSQFGNVKTRLYEWYTKLKVLSPNTDYAEQYLSIGYSALLGVNYTKARWSEDLKPYLEAIIKQTYEGNVSDFMDDLQKQAAREIQASLKLVITKEDKIYQFFNAVQNAFTIYANKVPNATLQQAARADETVALIEANLDADAQKAWSELSKKGKATGVLGTMGYGAVSGFLIYSIVQNGKKELTPTVVVQDINLGMLAAAALAKGINKLMSIGVGRYLTKFSKAGGGAFRLFAGELAAWFTKAGVRPVGALGRAMTKIFGESYAKFMATRIGPAMAVVGVVLAGFFLYDAIKTGDVRSIVFESINAFLALASLVLIGFELLSFAWAGPVGLAVAAVGLAVLAIQFIWNWIDPPPPPADPITDFVNGPMQAKGYAT